MTVIDHYREKMVKSIETIYNGKIDHDWIVGYVDNIIKSRTKDTGELKAECRNIYKYQFSFTRDPNLIIDEAENDGLNILANGLFTENFDPANKMIIDQWMEKRDSLKGLMLQAKKDGNKDDYRIYDGKQYKVKANTNAMYGASTMAKGWVSNIDMGGAITAQARNFISEMTWNIERFVASNMTFHNVNEIFLWISKLFEIKKDDYSPENMALLDYIPTPDDCRKRFIQITMDVPGLRKKMKDMQQSVFLMFEMMEDWKRAAFYYANNILEFFAKNKIAADVFRFLIETDVEFINPYSIPDELKTPINDLFTLMERYVFANIVVGERVYKFVKRERKTCVVGDTDSTMPSLFKLVENIFTVYGNKDLMNDQKTQIRVTMAIIALSTYFFDKCCLNYVKCCNSYHGMGKKEFYMKMKNEFFMPVLVLFPSKKNYIALQTIQEGNMVPEHMQLVATGSSLTASALNEWVSKQTLDLLTNTVIKVDNYDPLKLLRGEHEMENHIKSALMSGDKTFGIYSRYSGIANLKDPLRTHVVRACCIWNDLFPDDYIVPGDAVYSFTTDLIKEEDLDRFNPEYADIRERIRDVVFRSKGFMDYAKFGLKSFAIPTDGDCVKIPEWIIPYLNLNAITEKHLKPLTTLYSSLLLSPSTYRVNNTKKLGTSNLIRW